jgi:hypothetical protein
VQAEQLFGSNFKATVTNVNGDYTIDLLFKDNGITESANVVRYIVGELKDDIYAEFETTPESRLFDLLKLKKHLSKDRCFSFVINILNLHHIK